VKYLTTNGSGQCMAFPDVCNTPAPSGVAPLPYPNIGMTSQAKGSSLSSKVKILNKKAFTKKSEISRSSGDEAGTSKGVVSAKNMSKITRVDSSMKVKIEGDAVVMSLGVTSHNANNAPPGCQLSPTQTKVMCLF
jgi:hypothetical protein